MASSTPIPATSPRSGVKALTISSADVLSDPTWDQFLRSSPQGQFQQSSGWALFKSGEEWRCRRVLVHEGGTVVGGFQLLWKPVRRIRIGYVSKGPVLHPSHPDVAATLQLELTAAVRELRLMALVVQPPDESDESWWADDSEPVMESNPLGIIEATYTVELSGGRKALQSRIHGSLHKGLQKARKQPMVIRTGTAADLPRFHELMTATCRRQGVAPNPSTGEAMRRLWDSFTGTSAIRLTFAECEGELFAGILCLAFGDRVSLWKKGWDGSRGPWRANELLCYDAMEWSSDHGYRLFDLCGFNRNEAESYLKGRLEDKAVNPRDRFHLRLGGSPRLLPRARLLFPNRVIRWAYRIIGPLVNLVALRRG